MELSDRSRNGDPTPIQEAGRRRDSELAAGTTAVEQSESVRGKAVETAPVMVPAKNDPRSLPVAVEVFSVADSGGLPVANRRFPQNLPHELGLILAQNGKAYAVMRDTRNPYVLAVGSRRLNNIIRELARDEGVNLRKAEISEINDNLQAKAETAGVCKLVGHRVAGIPGGIEIDLGDDSHNHTRITAGKVEIIEAGSETLFCRTPSCQPMVRPAEVGNLKLLKKYLNLDDVSFLLFTAWLSYTLAHPKGPASKYVILVIGGGQGSGKSVLSRLILQLLDPSSVGVQIVPSNSKDLAIAAQNAHVLCYDNVRSFSPAMADSLCVAATGGALASRQLYTDAEQQVIYLHVALVLNGIHAFVDQPDLAQRCLPLHLPTLPEEKRKSEADMGAELQADLPAIQRGLFDLIAKVFEHLHTAKVTSPTRMIDFSKWLAAMEIANSLPAGVYQDVYCDALNQGQRDSLQECVLAAAVLEYAENHVKGEWSGTPTELLSQLNVQATHGTQRSREWPQNPIALSKRLVPLQAGLLSQGVFVELSRGKHRTITVKTTGGAARA